MLTFKEYLQNELNEMAKYNSPKDAKKAISRYRKEIIFHTSKVVRYTGNSYDVNGHLDSLKGWLNKINDVEMNTKKHLSIDDYVEQLWFPIGTSENKKKIEFLKLLAKNPQESYSSYKQAISNEKTLKITEQVIYEISKQFQSEKYRKDRLSVPEDLIAYIGKLTPSKNTITPQQEKMDKKELQKYVTNLTERND